jgi:hypothetical protein
MEKILDVQEILVSMREDDQQLEKLIADLKKEEKPSAVPAVVAALAELAKHPAPAFSTVNATRLHEMANPCPCLA